jgi:hypothetical protein
MDKSRESPPLAHHERAQKHPCHGRKIFTMKEHHNNQNKKIYAQTSLEVRSEGAGMPSPFLHHGLVGGVP